MGIEEEDVSRRSVKMSGNPSVNHNPQLRRRNVVDGQKLSLGSAKFDVTALLELPQSTKAWCSGIPPRIPEQQESNLMSKQNGILVQDEGSWEGQESNSDIELYKSKETEKIGLIRETVANPELTLGELRLLGCSSEGLVNDAIRRVLWPKLLRLSEDQFLTVNNLDAIHLRIPNDVYQQISKDVARSGSHMPQNASQEDMDNFHNELTQIMCWVLHRHSELNYYQGYNDVAATVLLAMGLQLGLYVLETISLEFLQRFMESTMEKVNQELFYIFALLQRIHPTLLEHLENVELFPHFALAEYTTWFAHKYAENRKLLHRLFDFFLGSPPLMPLYLSTVIVAHRAAEIFNTTPDMGHTHKVLCTLPGNLPFESLLVEATNLYKDYPPESINNDVREYDHRRRKKEQEWKAKAEARRLERVRQKKLPIVQSTPKIPYRIRSYKTITVVTILALGLYAFLKSSSGLN